MTREHADPAPSTSVVGPGSRRPGVVPLLVAAVLLTALVQGLVLQSYVVPSAALAPAVEPGDRVLVWKATPARPGDLVVVDTTDTAPVDRSTRVDAGFVGRALGALAELLGVEVGRQDRLAVVDAVAAATVTLGAPVPGPVPRGDVVGTVLWRVWPLDRLGAVPPAELVGVAW